MMFLNFLQANYVLLMRKTKILRVVVNVSKC